MICIKCNEEIVDFPDCGNYCRECEDVEVELMLDIIKDLSARGKTEELDMLLRIFTAESLSRGEI